MKSTLALPQKKMQENKEIICQSKQNSTPGKLFYDQHFCYQTSQISNPPKKNNSSKMTKSLHVSADPPETQFSSISKQNQKPTIKNSEKCSNKA